MGGLRQNERMRNRLLGLVTAVGLSAWAAPQVYFYSLPQTEGDQAWAFLVPECQPLSAAEFQRMKAAKQCVKHQKTAHQCTAEQQVELENANTQEKRKFPLSQFVFSSLKACQRDRKALLEAQGE
jgi:hypothetical protein